MASLYHSRPKTQPLSSSFSSLLLCRLLGRSLGPPPAHHPIAPFLHAWGRLACRSVPSTRSPTEMIGLDASPMLRLHRVGIHPYIDASRTKFQPRSISACCDISSHWPSNAVLHQPTNSLTSSLLLVQAHIHHKRRIQVDKWSEVVNGICARCLLFGGLIPFFEYMIYIPSPRSSP